MKINNTVDLVSFIVRNADASVDTEGTLVRFAEYLAEWERATCEANATLGTAINAVFDANPGRRLSADYIAGQVLPALGATPETWGETEKALVAWLKASPEFDSRVGKGGGWARKG